MESMTVLGPPNRQPLVGPYGRRIGWAYLGADGISVHAELTDSSFLDVRGFGLKSAVAPVMSVSVADELIEHLDARRLDALTGAQLVERLAVHAVDPDAIGDVSACGKPGPVAWRSSGRVTCEACNAWRSL